ncbi:hypothetical protein F5884DRAFT_845580 [Xylogone sp. PMI_703]|nr:hypothetical protein F5884DRAFT_845580 [Xylogone sp. PMI_703]
MKVLVIGGDGAQGIPVVKELVKNGYSVPSYPMCNIDDNDLHSAFKGVDYAFVNINSFAIGMKNEIYWGIRIFEIAVQSAVKHFVWSSLDNVAPKRNFSDQYRVGHYIGKGFVEQWISTLPQSPMRLAPSRQEDGTVVFSAPLNDGAIPFVHLDDLGHYVNWIFTNPEESAGFNLKVAIDHVHFKDLATAFTKVTGTPAIYQNTSIDSWFENGSMVSIQHDKLGAQVAGDDNTLLTWRENFSAWWRLYQESGGNKGLITRDYALLDRIHPNRVKTVEQWIQKMGFTGDRKSVLKDYQGA